MSFNLAVMSSTFPTVWTPDEATLERNQVVAFMAEHGIADWDELHARSVADPAWFWDATIKFLGIPFQRQYTDVLDDSKGVEWTTWFTDGKINMSEVCVDRWAKETPEAVAIKWEKETGAAGNMTYAALLDHVRRYAGILRHLGVARGDAVAVFLPMSREAVISMLAIARLGAVFVPVFSGFAGDAVASRLNAAQAKVLITADGVQRRGKILRMKEVADDAVAAAPSVRTVLVVDYSGRDDTPMTPGRDVWLSEHTMTSKSADAVDTDAEEVVMLTYTSGTTGKPKGVVHVHGGLTVKLAEEGAFQLDIQQGDTLMWITDMGWVMGQFLVVAGLANGAAIATFDGAPNYPDPGRLWDLVENLRVTVLGVSPTLIRTLQGAGDQHLAGKDLSSLRGFASTGEPWNPDPWYWLFKEVGNGSVPILNISGGTEIGACILSANLLKGVKATSLGDPCLGLSVAVLDDNGKPLGPGDGVGELAIQSSWPGMTRGFAGDPERYIDTYWSRWPGTWVHGDWASIDEDGHWYLHGRSDETLNIAGKRLGPAEVESAIVEHPQVVMSAAIAIPDEIKGEAIAVFVVANDPSPELATTLGNMVAAAIGKPFRPKHVVFVDDLPRTRSAKIMRRVVKAVATGKPTGDLSSLENPASLEGISPL